MPAYSKNRKNAKNLFNLKKNFSGSLKRKIRVNQSFIKKQQKTIENT